MGVNIRKYINLSKRYEKYGDDGYFIEPHIIKAILYGELGLPDVEEYVSRASIIITENEIKKFLDKKMDEEQPGLKQKLKEKMKTSSITLPCDEGEFPGKINASTEGVYDNSSRYYFEPYSLQYFKTYTSILKEKCQTLFSILNDINKCKSEKLSEEAKQRLLDLDFHINSKGNIHFKDAERLVDAIIYNVKKLCEKTQVGNCLQTYLTFKESKHDLMKDDIFESEIYSSRKIQIKDIYHAHMPGFIALSEAQQTQVQKEELKSFSKWLKRATETNKNEESAILKKTINDN